MKKIFTLIAVAFACVAGAQAQNVIVYQSGSLEANGSGKNLSASISKASDIRSIEILPSTIDEAAQNAEGSFTGSTEMNFTMLPGVFPTTVAGRTDTVSVTPIGGSRVEITFSSEMGHQILTKNAFVKGAYYQTVVSETEDSYVFDNRQADSTSVDYIQASMDGPVTADTKYYPCKVYGSINKTTGEGTIHMDTVFGAMGNVYFTFTAKAKETAKEK